MSYPSNDPSLPTSVKPGGVKLVGTLPQGFPPFTIPHVSVAELPLLVGGALGIALVSMTDTISTASVFSARNDQEIDAHQDMVGIGAANVAAGLFQGFPVSTSGSRTAVAEQSGAKTQLTGLVGAAAITLMLLFLPGLLRDLPQHRPSRRGQQRVSQLQRFQSHPEPDRADVAIGRSPEEGDGMMRRRGVIAGRSRGHVLVHADWERCSTRSAIPVTCQNSGLRF